MLLDLKTNFKMMLRLKLVKVVTSSTCIVTAWKPKNLYFLGFPGVLGSWSAGKSKTSILHVMKPPYNALQHVKLLGVKFMSA